MASASHFRQGNINWQEVAGAPAGQQRITVQYEQSWRLDAFGAPPAVGDIITTGETCINWGDGTPQECLSAVVEFVNEAENYMRIQALAPGSTTDINVPHDYADPTGTFTIRSTSCCTISELNNANDATWNVLSTVNLAEDDESAVSTIPAIVTLSPGGVQQFTVPAGDAGGETLFFRLADANESCAGCADPHPPGISIDSSTGVVTIDTTGLDGLNWTGVVIESRNAANEVVATTHIQFIIRVAAGGGNQPPVWDSPPTPADGAVFTVAPGDNVCFNMRASDPDSGDTVSILQNSGPGTFTAFNGNPATGQFNFTPDASDLGNDYIVQFIAQDPAGAGPPFRSYTIQVRAGAPVPETCPDPRPVEPEPEPEPEPIEPVPQAGACSNAIFGDSKGNSLQGTAGSDLLKGLRGNDNLNGLGGDDCVRGGPGSDKVKGGDGDDRLNGGQKSDKVGGGAGDDRIKVQAGRADVVRCGSGKDTVFAGRKDLIHKSCERVK